MNQAEALRSIRYDLLEYIQKAVKVDFDNTRSMPVHFFLDGRKHDIHEILGRFKTCADHHANGFLVTTDKDDVYFLYFQWHERNQSGPSNRGFWVLSFRILSDRELMAFYREERKMLVNMTLKRLVDFHGHLCPDLIIGAKACEYVQILQPSNDEPAKGISVLAENSTSALDAIQLLFGTTLGNQRLKVLDFGKHNYTFSFETDAMGLKLSLNKQHYSDEKEYLGFEAKIRNDRMSLDDVVYFQGLLDRRVKQLLISRPEDLFCVEDTGFIQHAKEMPSIYLTCFGCGQQLLSTRAVECDGKIFCIPCFQQINPGCIKHNFH